MIKNWQSLKNLFCSVVFVSVIDRQLSGPSALRASELEILFSLPALLFLGKRDMGIIRRSVAAIGGSKTSAHGFGSSPGSSPTVDTRGFHHSGSSRGGEPSSPRSLKTKPSQPNSGDNSGQPENLEAKKTSSLSPKSIRFLLQTASSSTPRNRTRRTKDVFGRLSSASRNENTAESSLNTDDVATPTASSDGPVHHSAQLAPEISSRTAAIHARTMAAAEAESVKKPSHPDAGRANSDMTSSTAGSGMNLSVANSLDIPDGRIQAQLPDRPNDSGYRGRKSSAISGGSASGQDVGLSEFWMIDHAAITLGKTIGHSSFGMVNEGRLNGTKVAVKTIKRDEKKENGDDIDAFKKEAELNCKLRHPNVVLFMGICVQPTEVCIVTELMARGNVHDLLVTPIKGKSVKLSWSLRLQWAIDTAQGMAYLHSLNPVMIHRDLKTTNLLVDRGMNVKICDFGLSRFQAEDKIMSAVGTVQFAAPEVLRHEMYTEKADLFSYGTVLWELFTRRTIFDGLPQILVYKSVVDGDMPPVGNGCDPRYAQLVRDCWLLDASKRPSFRDCLDRLTLMADEMSEEEY